MGWLRKQEVVEFCAASPTRWGAEEIVNGMGGFDLLDDWCEIRRFCEYKFKTAKSSSNCAVSRRVC